MRCLFELCVSSQKASQQQQSILLMPSNLFSVITLELTSKALLSERNIPLFPEQ